MTPSSILLVDDDRAFRRVYARLLSDAGHVVLEAHETAVSVTRLQVRPAFGQYVRVEVDSQVADGGCMTEPQCLQVLSFSSA